VSETSHYLCIGCPLGCRLEVDVAGSEIVEVRGFACTRGKRFAEQEHVDPRRHVTTTVRVRDGRWSRLPVKTTAAVPKGRVRELASALHELELHAPVHLGDVVMTDALRLGIDVVATRDMPREERVTPAAGSTRAESGSRAESGAPRAHGAQLPTSSMP
jgi:CxxC motif-containing protein